jgi:putative membrane protein
MARSERTPVQRGRRMSPRRIIVLVIVVLAALFIVQNRDTVQIGFFTLTVTASLWLLLVIMFVLGAIVGVLAGRRRR